LTQPNNWYCWWYCCCYCGRLLLVLLLVSQLLLLCIIVVVVLLLIVNWYCCWLLIGIGDVSDIGGIGKLVTNDGIDDIVIVNWPTNYCWRIVEELMMIVDCCWWYWWLSPIVDGVSIVNYCWLVIVEGIIGDCVVLIDEPLTEVVTVLLTQWWAGDSMVMTLLVLLTLLLNCYCDIIGIGNCYCYYCWLLLTIVIDLIGNLLKVLLWLMVTLIIDDSDDCPVLLCWLIVIENWRNWRTIYCEDCYCYCCYCYWTNCWYLVTVVLLIDC